MYDADPRSHPDAKRFERLSYEETLARRLAVMDATAVVLCQEQDLPLMVFNIHERGNLLRAVCGEPVGTLVERE